MHIHCIRYHPRRIAWSKGRGSANTVLTAQQAKALLQEGEGAHIDIQLAKLNGLESHEKLVIQRKIKPYWVVNVSSFKDASGHSHYQKIRTSEPGEKSRPLFQEIKIQFLSQFSLSYAHIKAFKKQFLWNPKQDVIPVHYANQCNTV